jgi:long-chain fatty acid transport protein
MRTKILALALLVPTLALANGYDVPNVSPRDLALGSSFLAAPVDAGAVYNNSAALARLGPGLNLNLGGSVLILNTEWTDTSGKLNPSPAKLKFKPVPPVALFGSFGFKAGQYDAALGAGLNVVAGGNVFWPGDWAGRGRIITVDRKIYAGYLSGAFALSEYVRLGAQGIYYYGTEYLKQGIQPYPDAFGELATKGGQFSFGLSIDVTPNDQWSIAADYKDKATMHLTGNGNFVVPPALAPSVQDQSLYHDLTYPSVLNLGVAYKATKALQLGFTWTYNWYEVYKSDTFVGSKGTTINVPRDYGNGQTFRLGAEYAASPQLTLRAGAERDLSGLNTDTYSPTLPDSNAWTGSLGAGWRFSPALQLNAALFYAKLDKVTATGAEAMPGSYDTNVWIGSVGVSWWPGARAGK